jgi:hypothetical protein
MAQRIKNPRQIRYNWEIDTAEQASMRYRWAFLVLNSRRECDRIRDKIIEAMACCADMEELESGIVVPNGSLVGRLITLNSERGDIQDKNRIYNTGKWHKDRALGPMNDIELEVYVSRFKVPS